MTLSSRLFSFSDHLANIVPPVGGKRAEILIKTDQLRVILMNMTATSELLEHFAPGQITIQPISGRFTITVGEESFVATANSLLTIDAQIRHSVVCQEDGAFILTISWPHGADDPTGTHG